MIGGKDEVRCAIVDSGVQRELSGNNIFGGITFKRSEAGIEIIENEYQDENGHGSMVYRTLAQTDTEFYIVKVLNESNQGNSLTLCEALKWLLNIEVKLIVICISTNNLEMGQEYEKLINKLLLINIVYNRLEFTLINSPYINIIIYVRTRKNILCTSFTNNSSNHTTCVS